MLQVAGSALKYDNLNEIRVRLNEVSPNLLRYGDVEVANFYSLATKLAQVWFDPSMVHVLVFLEEVIY